MPNKQFVLESGLAVHVYKRKSNRSLRLSITPHGTVRVTIPAWAPYRAGVDFAQSRQQWILAQRSSPRLLQDGQPIGKAHHLHFKVLSGTAKPAARIVRGTIVVSYPISLASTAPDVQDVAQKAAIRALRAQAESLLPQRVASLAEAHNFTYNSVSIKYLKSRWGSCDHRQNIVLNLFLMQLPWKYIDYVILHELTHTRLLKHGPEFWRAMEELLSNVLLIRKELRNFQPILDLATESKP